MPGWCRRGIKRLLSAQRPSIVVNRYACAANDSINKSDPNGHCAGVCTAAIVVTLAALEVADWGLTAWDAWNDARDVASGNKTISQVAKERAPGTLIGMALPGGKLLGKSAKSFNPSFAQKIYRSTFIRKRQKKYTIKIRKIDDVANTIKNGTVKSKDVPIQSINRKGVDCLLNTRTTMALKKAGVKKKDWNIKDA